MRLIDTHCHFDDVIFDPDRVELLQEMPVIGVTDLVLPAIRADSWPDLRAVCADSPRLHATYGLHPIYLAEHRHEHLQQLQDWLADGDAVAVGECGLDFFLPELEVETQITYFAAQLRLAREFDLPVIVHARRSVDAVLKQIRRIGGLRGVIHSFAGSQQQADLLIAQGFYLGIGGTVTYERAQRLRKIVACIPDEAIVLETDAPDQPDSAWRGQRNDPLRLPVIAGHLAALRRVSIAKIAAISTLNAQRLFGIR